MSILRVNSCSIDQELGEICTVQTDLQQIYSKSDRLLVAPLRADFSCSPIIRIETSGKICDYSCLFSKLSQIILTEVSYVQQ